jgi:hypothetical protein
MSKKRAALAAGIGESTYQLWQTKAKEAKEIGKSNEYLIFIERLDAALAEGEYIALDNVQKFGKKDWRAYAWWLEHALSNTYGTKSTVKAEHSGEVRIIINGEHKP